MADVTVLGAGGATVTIALTSQQNADAAQAALKSFNDLSKANVAELQIQGAGSLPATSAFLAGAVFNDTGANTTSGSQYIFFGANGTGSNVVLGGDNAKTVVVAGNGSNLTYANQSADGQVWFGKNNSTLANFKGGANVVAEDGNYLVATDAGATTKVSLASGGIVAVAGLGSKGGSTTINAEGNATVQSVGASTVPATVNGGSAGNMLIATNDASSLVINPGGANATVVSVGTGASTLFGGSGKVFVAQGIGEFTGGTAGGNVMFSSTVPGSATLVGGGNIGQATVGGVADILIAQGSGQTLRAGIGNASLVGIEATGATGGSTYSVGAGFSTVFGYEKGGNTFAFFGFGASVVDGRDTSIDLAQTKANLFVDQGNSGGTYVIGDFVSGFDQFQVLGDFTITFLDKNDPSNTFGVETTTLTTAAGATYRFFDSTPDGVAEIKNSDVTKIG